MKKLSFPALIFALTAASAFAASPAENWTSQCAKCHGKDGAGHTRSGKKLGIKDLTAAENQKAFSDDDAFTALKSGLKDKDGATKMNPFATKLSDDDIKALVAYVRAMAK